MSEQLLLTAEERVWLVDLLERTLNDKRVEEHRTRSPSFREHLVRDEKMMETILAKLKAPQMAAV